MERLRNILDRFIMAVVIASTDGRWREMVTVGAIVTRYDQRWW